MLEKAALGELHALSFSLRMVSRMDGEKKGEKKVLKKKGKQKKKQRKRRKGGGRRFGCSRCSYLYKRSPEPGRRQPGRKENN